MDLDGFDFKLFYISEHSTYPNFEVNQDKKEKVGKSPKKDKLQGEHKTPFLLPE